MRHTVKAFSAFALCALTLMPCTARASYLPQPPQEGKEGKCRPPFHPEQFIKDLTAYVTRQAGLTESEAKAFFPVYFEMKSKQHDIQRRIEKNLAQGAAPSSSAADCRRVLAGVASLEKKKAQVTSQYVDRLVRMVGPEKTVRALAADQSFGRGQFRRMAGKGK